MEIGRHAPDMEPGHTSIQSLQMPWANMSSRPTSRQPSADPHRPASQASFEGGLRRSVSRGFFDDGFSGGWPSSPVVARTQRASQVTFSQMEREMVEKDSAEFYEYEARFEFGGLMVGFLCSFLGMRMLRVRRFRRCFLLKRRRGKFLPMPCLILAVCPVAWACADGSACYARCYCGGADGTIW
jgi:hypothetical protein